MNVIEFLSQTRSDGEYTVIRADGCECPCQWDEADRIMVDQDTGEIYFGDDWRPNGVGSWLVKQATV